jgi:hypothetical protein
MPLTKHTRTSRDAAISSYGSSSSLAHRWVRRAVLEPSAPRAIYCRKVSIGFRGGWMIESTERLACGSWGDQNGLPRHLKIHPPDEGPA